VGDGVEQIGGRVIRVLASQPDRFGAGVVLDPLPGQAGEFHPAPCANRIAEADGVAGDAMHVAMALGRATIAAQDGDLVERFRRPGAAVPHHARGLQMGLRIPLLGVDAVTELERSPDEEDRRVVPNQIPMPFLGIELQRKSPRIARAIG
jgi:hypothetical protein